MAQDPLSKSAADYDAVVAQLAALREDMAKLAGTLTQSATRRGQTMVQDVTDGMTEAARYMSNQGHAAEVRLESAVAANPYVSLGIAAAMGMLLGALTRR